MGSITMYEVIRIDRDNTVVLLRSEDYQAAKELYDWFSTHMRCFSYKMRKVY